MRAKFAEGQEERSVVRMRLEPSLGAFDLPDDIVPYTFAIKLG
jgi:hypothetical protein